jgi:hypothetical protein
MVPSQIALIPEPPRR